MDRHQVPLIIKRKRSIYIHRISPISHLIVIKISLKFRLHDKWFSIHQELKITVLSGMSLENHLMFDMLAMWENVCWQLKEQYAGRI